MPRQLVVCLDGTGNRFSATPTNILRIVRSLNPDPAEVLSYYDQGVGTFGLRETLFKWQQQPARWLGLAFGWGLSRTVGAAYTFLAQNYQEGDEVYIFGFSRGAYTARALAAMLFACGLIEPHQLNLLEYAWAMLTARTRPTPQQPASPDFNLQTQFKQSFGRAIPIKFLGLFDTVKSVGWVYDQTVIPWTRRNPSVMKVRHALAMDERRVFFRPEPWTTDPKLQTDVSEVWFAGVHSDIGGGYPVPESSLAGVSLCWMLGEAIADGLKVDRARALSEMQMPHGVKPDLLGAMHDSMPGWAAAEWMPTYAFDSNTKQRKLNVGAMPPLHQPAARVIPPNARLHVSVKKRIETAIPGRPAYRPINLPAAYSIVNDNPNSPCT